MTSVIAGASAALFTAYPENIYFIVPARILGGLSYGIAYLTVLIHASEVATPRLRGMIVSAAHFCFMVGVFVTSSSLLPVYQARNYEIDPTRTIGLNGMICIATGLLLAVFLNRESPVFLIRKYRDQDALSIMIRLRSESHETADIRRDFNEFKLMVMEDGGSNLNIFDRKNRWPLIVVLAMKVIFVASFNMPLNLVWLEATETQVYNGTVDPSGMYLSGTRMVVMMATMFLIDLKRVKFYILSSGFSAVVLILLIYFLRSTNAGYDESVAITILAFAFQVFSGFALGLLTDVIASEAFNTKKKPLSIALASSLEFLLHILLVVTYFYLKISTVAIVSTLGIVMSFGLFALTVPDTSGMSLRNARNKFGS